MPLGVPKSLPGFPQLISNLWIGFAAFSVLMGSYLTAELGGLLVVRPQMIWPVWPGNAFLVAILVFVPRKTWPIFLTAGLAGFILYDLHAGLAIRFIALLNLADMVETGVSVLSSPSSGLRIGRQSRTAGPAVSLRLIS